MKHFGWIVTLPLVIVVVVFSVRNIAETPIDLWPITEPILLPTYLVVLFAILFGFLFGAAVMWFSVHRTRREARRQRAEVKRLTHELESLRKASEARTTATENLTGLPAATTSPRLPAAAQN